MGKTAKKAPKKVPGLFRYYSPDIPMTAIRRYARQIAEKFDPDKIILFGSYAYGQPHEWSDVDILVVMPAYDEINQSIRITLASEAPFSLDLIIRTPDSVRRGLEEEDWFIREVIAKGKVIYPGKLASKAKALAALRHAETVRKEIRIRLGLPP